MGIGTACRAAIRRAVGQNECAGLKSPLSASSREKIMESLEPRVLFSINPTGAEQEMLEMVNRFRAAPQDELEQLFISTDPSSSNYFRSPDSGVNAAMDFFNVNVDELKSQISQLNSAPPLAWNEALMDSSEAHSNEMISQDAQAHILPGEPGLLDRMVAAGYNWSGSVSVSENVFAYTENVFHGHSAFVIDWGSTPTGIQDPAGHRDNLLDPDLQEVGISIIAESNPSTSVGPLVVTQDFGVRGNYGNAQVVGVAFGDSDGDHFYDAGEGLGGVTITVSNGSASYTATTMSAGGYQVPVAAGTYSVVASGGGLTAPMFMGQVTVGTDNVKLDLDSANPPPSATVTGTVYLDADFDGARDGGETGAGGFSVFADVDADGQLDPGEISTMTNASGSFTLTGLSGGTYQIAVATRGGYVATTATSQSVVAITGSVVSGTDFGQFQWLDRGSSSATVHGTPQDDSITVRLEADGTTTVGFNGKGQVLSSAVTNLTVESGAGADLLNVTGSAADETAILRPGSVYMTGGNITLYGTGSEDIRVDSGGGEDLALLHDAASDDSFSARVDHALLEGSGFRSFVSGFSKVKAIADAGGTDLAVLYDGVSNDTFVGRSNYSLLEGNGFHNWAEGFDKVTANATLGGNDSAFLYDGTGDDTYASRPEYAYLWGTGFFNLASGFDVVKGYASTGKDSAFAYDSPTNDVFSARPEFAFMRADDRSYFNFAFSFDSVRALGSGAGNDLAYLYDSSGNDVFSATSSQALLRAADNSFFNFVSAFDKVNAFGGNGGADDAFLYDSAGDDVFTTTSSHALMRSSSSSYFNYVRAFDRVFGYSQAGGNDTAFMNDSTGNDLLTARLGYASLGSSTAFARANNFNTVHAYGNNGGTNTEDLAATLDYVLQQYGTWL